MRTRTACTIAVLALALGFAASLNAQDALPVREVKPTLPSTWINVFEWRSIGPAVMGGRITDVAVYEADPTTYSVATASGGVLRTIDAGISFKHQFYREATASIGAIAVARNDSKIVWVGTGEANPRNSVSWGDGVYKSVNGGNSWKNMGLRQSFQIGAIAIDPTDTNIVYVGALGRLWGPNEERGLFKTEDGGETWNKILYIDQDTGVIDVQMNPSDPSTLLIATYQRRRDATDANSPIVEWGDGSGIYRTTDRGKTFEKITIGLPNAKLGRIGLEYYRSDPNVVYAMVQSEKTGKEPQDAAYFGIRGEDAGDGARITDITKNSPAEIAKLKIGDIILSLEDTTIHSYNDLLKQMRSRRPGGTVKLEISRERESIEVEVAFTRLPGSEVDGDPQQQQRRQRRNPYRLGPTGQRQNMQDQQGPKGADFGGVYKSTDGGVTWARINSLNPRPMYYSEIRVDPSDSNYLYVLGNQLYISKDGGKTFTPNHSMTPVHSDHHALWIDPNDGRHLVLGNDGGLYVTHDRGVNWDHHNDFAIGQFYHVAVDRSRNYRVYGGLQDNGSWGGPNRDSSGAGSGVLNEHWFELGRGDGFICAIDRNDPDWVYYEGPFGSNVQRRNLLTGEQAYLQYGETTGPSHRFNWKKPFLLSIHNPRIVYIAGNYVLRSLDRGNDLEVISPEISLTDTGAATALAESPIDSNVLYVGTTDGALWVTTDSGLEWTPLIDKPEDVEEEGRGSAVAKGNRDDKYAWKAMSQLIPAPRWVSSIEASHFEASRAYITFDGHRSDDDEPYVFVTEDYGKSWRSLRANLPTVAGSTRVIREDIKNANLLYLGCEFGAWLSIDRGESWTTFRYQLPTVAVHEFAIHLTAGEIVAATHGRSLWILDVTTLRQISADTISEAVHLYKPNDAILWRRKLRRGSGTARRFVGKNPVSGVEIFYSLNAVAHDVSMKIINAAGKMVHEPENLRGSKHLHHVSWDLYLHQSSPSKVEPGVYRVVLTVDGNEYVQEFSVVRDPDNPSSRRAP